MKAPDLMRGFFYIDVTSHLYEDLRSSLKSVQEKEKAIIRSPFF